MATSTPDSTPPKKRKLGLLLIAVLVLAAAGAGGAYYFFYYSKQAHTPVLAAPIAPIFVALEPFTVNLQPGGRARFLHVGVTLKVADAKTQALVVQYLPEVRSRVLTVLSNRQADALVEATDKAQLAVDLMAALNLPFAATLAPQKIASVMFTAFMLQ
ncbi:MAG: flagellar basal body-associated protein FliL [Polaromonas sp. 24-62-144]|jgi:flagellar FliL protein|uniref:flagellar basal body-associated protein FliL n=1 Tax=Polaromonas sp. TaxID=1869339 RepID=UPI000BD26EBD|nr:flagellar basal body-associated protein FliL [Polaromonas sp.]OYY53919.1 MAG: flagellar basal body-associated protein FliL [Polaromonas sp. 35-63-240]OYZ02447.1 MAG: flagellar basal body-associated protein FliL [Polaromonas sp. 28-63-22]OYZ84910.1 MAG: flagellar basal body-associated protein FliL [Polaromonas sp. 24-62-144]HQS31586.1 flagellar basal body-associated protein FliL [Polaromonas sp.]HQS90083.1 flagellar basal body-associated protein FliL [Polaromonas sp.]